MEIQVECMDLCCSIRKDLSAVTDSVSVNYKYLLAGLLATMGCGFSLQFSLFVSMIENCN